MRQPESFHYSKDKTIAENNAEFEKLPKREQQSIIESDHISAFRHENDLAESARRQDIETAQRAANGDTALEGLYQGFFGSRENCEMLAQHIPESMYAIEHPVIVDAGSSQGTLGNYVRERFEDHGRVAELILIDTNGVAMEQSPVQATKIVGNLVEIPLLEESADVIILRSVLQYSEVKDQIKILEGIKRVLKPEGILLSQFASYDSQQQADAFNSIFSHVRRVKFCGKEEGISMHKEVFGDIDEIAEGPTLFESFDDFFVNRIKASEEVITEAKKHISENVGELGSVLTSKEDPYSWKMDYTIVRCKKTEKKPLE
jgi:ubiquinone/menaquinone biosynthesis C-methylase UbiE